jgi:replicative DNA helicase
MDIIAKIQQRVKEHEAIKFQIANLEELTQNEFTTYDEIEQIHHEIQKLQDRLPLQSLQRDEKKLEGVLDQFDLDIGKIEVANIQYLLDNVVVKADILMIAAKPGQGKSLMASAVCNMALSNGTVSQVIYMDADNGSATLNERGIPQIKERHGKKFRYIHESNSTKIQMWQLIKMMKTTDLHDTLVIIDSIKNFMGKGDRDKNKDVSEIMDIWKGLRKQGATVIFLHHTNKPQRDFQELQYAGSSAFEEDTSNAVLLKYNEFRKAFIFKPLKNRVGKLEEVAFQYQAQTHILTNVDLAWAKETNEDEMMRIEIIDFIGNFEGKPNYSEIMKYISDMGFAKDRINRTIQEGKGKYWIAEILKEQNNKNVFALISSNKPSDNSDKSDNSINRALKNDTTASNTSDNSDTGEKYA